MVKKPEELKKGIHNCKHDMPCNECPYYGDLDCMATMFSDSQAYMLTLEADKAKLQAQNAELVKRLANMEQACERMMKHVARVREDFARCGNCVEFRCRNRRRGNKP